MKFRIVSASFRKIHIREKKRNLAKKNCEIRKINTRNNKPVAIFFFLYFTSSEEKLEDKYFSE